MHEQLEILRRIVDKAVEGNKDNEMVDILNHLHTEITVTQNLYKKLDK